MQAGFFACVVPRGRFAPTDRRFWFCAGCSISKTSDRFRKSHRDSEIGAATPPQMTHLLDTAARLPAAFG
ncbi:MAG: hypothetical protein CL535_02050 [Ahrensia sp.]|nr:hypothetical protein [Ahrensia sp.]